ncbi:uncharacterized protein AB9W97_011311 isoform 1-T6 [Spinachia spinachia]
MKATSSPSCLSCGLWKTWRPTSSFLIGSECTISVSSGENPRYVLRNWISDFSQVEQWRHLLMTRGGEHEHLSILSRFTVWGIRRLAPPAGALLAGGAVHRSGSLMEPFMPIKENTHKNRSLALSQPIAEATLIPSFHHREKQRIQHADEKNRLLLD